METEKRKYVRHSYTLRDLKREVKALYGKEVYIFGQKTTLDKECDSFSYDILDFIDGMIDSNSEYNLVELCKQFNVPKEKYESILDSNEYDINTELAEFLVEIGLLNEVERGSDNSYNWCSPINHHFVWHTYTDIYDNYYILVSVHRYGDVRANYTDAVCLKFDSDYGFMSILEECFKTVDIEYKGCWYACDIEVLKEDITVRASYNGEELFYAYGTDKEEITNEIQEYIEKRNANVGVGTEIAIYDLSNREDYQNLIANNSYSKLQGKVIKKDTDKGTITVDIGTKEIEILDTDIFEIE